VHGRTRACAFVGAVEYETIRAVKAAVGIPVTANGDVDSPEKARDVLALTGADALMIGRAAQGRPWIFREVRHYLDHGVCLPPPEVQEIRSVILEHLADHHSFYGEAMGVRTARKHLGWYSADLVGGEAFRHEINRLDSAAAQIRAVEQFFDQLAAYGDRLEYRSSAQSKAHSRSALAAAPASWVEEALAA
jgi:tRNA-dihydrouridine synthase B